MIFLFHGEDLSPSRQAFLTLKSSYPPLAVEALAADISPDDFRRVCGNAALFSETRLLTLEFFGKKRPRALSPLLTGEKLAECLLQKPPACHLAFWFEGLIPNGEPLLAAFKKAAARIFSFQPARPANVFSFLESLAARDKKTAFKKLSSFLQNGEGGFYLLRMIAWKLRQLLLRPEKFSEEELVRFYGELYRLEVEAKSGKADLPLGLFRLVEEITG